MAQVTELRLPSNNRGSDSAHEGFAAALEKADRWPEARVLREEVLAARRRNLGEGVAPMLGVEVRLAVDLSLDNVCAEALSLALHARDTDRQLGVGEQAAMADQILN